MIPPPTIDNTTSPIPDTTALTVSVMAIPLAPLNRNLLLAELNQNHLDTLGGKIPLLYERLGGRVHAWFSKTCGSDCSAFNDFVGTDNIPSLASS